MTLALYRYRLPLTHPLLLGGRRLDERQGLLVHVAGQWGEIAPLPGFSRENLSDAEGESLTCLAALRRGEKIAPRLPSVQFGFDCARRRWPTRAAPLPEPYPLLRGTPEEWLASVGTRRGRALRKVKLKVARHPMADELASIQHICEHHPSLELVLDANCRWSRTQALAFCTQLEPGRIDYLEDPCADFADIAAVAEATGIAVALDELLTRRAPWHPIAQLKALVLKPTLLGSLAHSEALVTKARTLGLEVVASSSFESDLGLGLLARLAAEWAPGQAPGLDTRHWLASSLLDERHQPRPDFLTRLFYDECYRDDRHD
ncbi:o-succinylbenzoate synthase [Billgrantia endophytica]|uniref:o-succinylbenzoate synthase n=1 Tax=Billgrantia endophytica TaxID=2033802 RepID=A0A2N7U3U3_9GAMM|nr:o-succinylbenzoate synthase [Halomonas endophytica]PMR75108.1 o-succinylbenzoate synthase [Halomonas endophytica]